MTEFKLTRQEVDSALWQKLRAYFDERITTNREMNDQNLDEKRTAEVRASIRVFKELIGLETDPDAS